jgi:hypothetical protein
MPEKNIDPHGSAPDTLDNAVPDMVKKLAILADQSSDPSKVSRQGKNN